MERKIFFSFNGRKFVIKTECETISEIYGEISDLVSIDEIRPPLEPENESKQDDGIMDTLKNLFGMK